MSATPYWFVDLPGLTREQADAVVQWARTEFGLSGAAVDPAEWLTMHLDADTVRAMAEAAASQPAGREIAAAMAENFQDWLDATHDGGRA